MHMRILCTQNGNTNFQYFTSVTKSYDSMISRDFCQWISVI
jgi:hypothetical protein